MRRLQVRWQNFRSFADTRWLDIRPITVVVGPNNSGKTSVLAPLLLLKQTLESQVPETALLTRGPLVDVGSFRDLVHGHRDDRTVQFGIRWHHHPEAEPKRPRGTDPPGAAHVAFALDEARETVKLERFDSFDVYLRPLLTRRHQEDGTYSVERIPGGGTIRRTSPTASESEKLVVQAIREARPRHFLFTSEQIARAIFSGIDVNHEHEGPYFISTRGPTASSDLYQAIVDYTRFGLEEVTDELYYIGPLRERPRRLYELSGEMPRNVGTRGQDAPEIIFRWSQDDTRKFGQIRTWLRRFGFTKTLDSTPQGDYAFSLSQRAGKATRTAFIDLGFGVSQVLPLIVQGLHAPPDSLLIAEQPEIHLNPRLQATLADWMVALARSRRGVLVETHSEHLLLRLRRLVAEGRIGSEMIALYYVEKRGARSNIREVVIQPNGHIESEDWPSGFFDEPLRDALGLARAQMDDKATLAGA